MNEDILSAFNQSQTDSVFLLKVLIDLLTRSILTITATIIKHDTNTVRWRILQRIQIVRDARCESAACSKANSGCLCEALLPKTAAVSRSFRGASRARRCLISHYSRAHYRVTGPFCPFPVRLPLAERGAHERRGKTVAPYRSPYRGTDGRMGFRTVSYVDRGPRVDGHVNRARARALHNRGNALEANGRATARIRRYHKRSVDDAPRPTWNALFCFTVRHRENGSAVLLRAGLDKKPSETERSCTGCAEGKNTGVQRDYWDYMKMGIENKDMWRDDRKMSDRRLGPLNRG